MLHSNTPIKPRALRSIVYVFIALCLLGWLGCSTPARKELGDHLKADFSVVEEFRKAIGYQGLTAHQAINVNDSSYLAVTFRKCRFPGVVSGELDALSLKIASRLEQENNFWGIYREVRITFTADSIATTKGHPEHKSYTYRKEDF